MPYAVIAWKPPADASSGDIAGIEAEFRSLNAIPFFRGLCLVDDKSPNWKVLRTGVSKAVASHPGMEAMLIMPSKGNRAKGWVGGFPSDAELKRARKLMNQSGSKTYPVLEKVP